MNTFSLNKILVFVTLVFLDSTLCISSVYASFFEQQLEQDVEKVVKYRKAVWVNDNGVTVEQLLQRALDIKPEVADTKFEYKSDVDAQISQRHIGHNDTGLYFTLFSEGEDAGTVQNAGPGIGRASAPDGQEFLKTGLHLIARGDHLGFVSNGRTNDHQISNLFHRLFDACEFPSEDTQFQYMPRANRGEIERLIRRGVKSIDLGVTSYATVVDDINRGISGGWGEYARTLGRQITNAFGRDRSAQEAFAAGHIDARVLLTFNGNRSPDLTAQMLAEVAEEIVNEEEQFKITTILGDQITPDSIVVSSKINIDGDSVLLDTDSAFSSIRYCLDQWRGNGFLAE